MAHLIEHLHNQPQAINRKGVSLGRVLCLPFIWIMYCAETIAKPNIEAIEAGVVRIITRTSSGTGTGTGFIVDNTVVVTNHHVVAGGTDFKLIPSGSRRALSASIIATFPALDLAFLRTASLGQAVVSLSLAPLQKGDAVWALGFPGLGDRLGLARDPSLTSGAISRLFAGQWQDNTRALDLIQHTAAINPGNSGGPLFDNCGRVIGVNTQGSGSRIVRGPSGKVLEIMAGTGVFFASHIKESISELTRLGISINVVSTRCITATGVAQAEAARAQQQAQSASAAAATAQAQVIKATSVANQAVEEARQAQQSSHQTAQTLHTFSHKMGVWVFALAGLTFIALLLTLRKPRQEIIRIVEKYSRRGNVSKRGHLEPSKEMILTGVDSIGNAVRIALSPEALSHTYGVSLGRDPQLADYFINNNAVSRRHVRFSFENNRYYIEDLNSSYGTIFNQHALIPFKKVAFNSSGTVELGAQLLALRME